MKRHLSLNLHKNRSSSLSCYNHGDSSSNCVQFTQNRCFFFGSGNNNNDNDDAKGKGDEGKDDEDKEKQGGKDDEKDVEDNKGDKKDDNEGNDSKDDESTSSDDPEPSPSLNNSSKYKKSTRSTIVLGHSTPSNVWLPARRLGFGDQSPKYPNLLALPVIRGPVFPGVLVCQLTFMWFSSSCTQLLIFFYI